jgi:aspartate/methionine/tyrosine aminotransferase
MLKLKVAINANVETIPHSPTLLVNEQVNVLHKKGNEVYHFGFGQSPFPAPELLEKSLAECAKLNKTYHRLQTSFADEYALSPDAQEETCQKLGPGKKMLLLNTPNNPTGRIYSDVSQWRLEKLGLNCLQTQGGFYLFPDFNNLRDSLKEKNITTNIELADHQLKNHQVAMLPGSAFYMPDDHLSLRMAPVDFDGRELISQSFDNQQLTESNTITKLFPNVVAGLDKISEFVSRLNS